jgi:hypothetical protein
MRASTMVACAAFVACSSAGGTREGPASAAVPAEGTYDYIANLPGQQVRGKLRVIGDTVLVEPESDYCRPTVGTPDALRIQYTCNGPGSFEQIRLFIDRRSPAQLSKWSATFRVQRRRDVCVRYAIQNGRQVCVETRTETYETTESRSGTLQVRRVP